MPRRTRSASAGAAFNGAGARAGLDDDLDAAPRGRADSDNDVVPTVEGDDAVDAEAERAELQRELLDDGDGGAAVVAVGPADTGVDAAQGAGASSSSGGDQEGDVFCPAAAPRRRGESGDLHCYKFSEINKMLKPQLKAILKDIGEFSENRSTAPLMKEDVREHVGYNHREIEYTDGELAQLAVMKLKQKQRKRQEYIASESKDWKDAAESRPNFVAVDAEAFEMLHAGPPTSWAKYRDDPLALFSKFWTEEFRELMLTSTKRYAVLNHFGLPGLQAPQPA